MQKPVVNFQKYENEALGSNAMVMFLDEYRVVHEETLLKSLVQNFNNKSLTEKDAFLAVAELAAIRNAITHFRK